LLLCPSADPTVLDLHPQGATPAYAAPEVLRSLQQQYEGAEWDDTLVNGPSADWWSVGVVLFSLLTGDMPFSDERSPSAREAPVTVSFIRFSLGVVTMYSYPLSNVCHAIAIIITNISLFMIALATSNCSAVLV